MTPKHILAILLLVAVLAVPVGAASTRVVIYPSADGYAMEDSNEGFYAMRNDAGDWSSATGTSIGTFITTTGTPDQWSAMRRVILVFNTSFIGAGNTTLYAVLRTTGNAKSNAYTEVPHLVLTGGSVANNTTVGNTDYALFTQQILSTNVSYADFPTDNSNVNFTISNLSYINKAGNTTFFLRQSFDVDNSSPTWGYEKTSSFVINSFEDAEARRPYLELVYGDAEEAPVSSFDVDYTGGISPLLVNFTDNSTNSPTVWKWYDGDTQFNANQSPKQVVFTTGNHLIKLNASNSAGGANTTGTWINVTDAVTVLPVPDFSANETLCTAFPCGIQFTDLSESNILGYNWSFGDGYNSSDSNPVHTFAAVGDYDITLEVTNASGTNTTTKTGYIAGALVPVAAFTANVTVGIAPLTVAFTDTSTNPPTDWDWYVWANETKASDDQNPEITFLTAGNYNIRLYASNAAGGDWYNRTAYVRARKGVSSLAGWIFYILRFGR